MSSPATLLILIFFATAGIALLAAGMECSAAELRQLPGMENRWGKCIVGDTSMIHHIDFAVTDFECSREFYSQALSPLGLSAVMDRDHDDGRRLVGFGVLPDPVFWIRNGEPLIGRLHVAFSAESRAAVDAFHEAALLAGGSSKGEPGLRSRYAAHYYAAYILDPDGHNIEAVCRLPE